MLDKRDQVRKLMYQCDQKSILIQTAIHTDPVIFAAYGMAIIAQYTLPFAGNSQVHVETVKVAHN